MENNRAKSTAVPADLPGPSVLVARELGRVLGALLLLPFQVFGQWLHHAQRLREVRSALQSTASLAPDSRDLELPARAVRVFVSCAEASGETHACNLVDALKDIFRERRAPAPELIGLGGERLESRGVRTVGNPVSQARMGFGAVLGALPYYVGLVRDAARELASGRVDLFIGVDSPALNVPLAHIAKRCGVPTVQYITPQYWGWAPWRVQAFGQAVDCALSILPFEPAWFQAHGVRVEHVGHPLLDELALRNAPRACVEVNASAPHVLALLPGSRSSVIERNLPIMLASARVALAVDDSWRVRISVSDARHRARIENLVEKSGLSKSRVEVCDDLERALHGATASLSVSGTILIHLLDRRLPCVVIYKLENALQAWIGKHFLTVPYFASVNLLAGKAVYPEFSFAGDAAPPDFQRAVDLLLKDPATRAQCSRDLEEAARKLGPPGASRRAALAALSRLSATSTPDAIHALDA